MKISGNWREYNHALIPSVPPHVPLEKSDIRFLNERNLLRLFIQNHIFFAEYITDWDSPLPYPMFYLIKDSFGESDTLPSEERRQRRHSSENFLVQEISPPKCMEQLFVIYSKASEKYPAENRTVLSFDEFKNAQLSLARNGAIYLGAFDKETDILVGYKIYFEADNRQVNQLVQKIIPEFEKKRCATALQVALCEKFEHELKSGEKYLCNGERSFRHKTNHQSFLMEHFYFRQSHCALHVRMCLLMKITLVCLMPFTRFLKKSHKKIFYDIAVVEEMWKTARLCESMEKNNKNTRRLNGGGGAEELISVQAKCISCAAHSGYNNTCRRCA